MILVQGYQNFCYARQAPSCFLKTSWSAGAKQANCFKAILLEPNIQKTSTTTQKQADSSTSRTLIATAENQHSPLNNITPRTKLNTVLYVYIYTVYIYIYMRHACNISI